jgi:hypothetical protein
MKLAPNAQAEAFPINEAPPRESGFILRVRTRNLPAFNRRKNQ